MPSPWIPPSASLSAVLRLLLLVLLILPLSARASDRLAVLEIDSDQATPELLLQLSDKLRAGALQAVQASGATMDIMTRESMAAILGDMGLDVSCVEGQCEVETARNLRAALVISGSMIQLEGTWVLTLKLHEAESGRLLATEEARSTQLLALLDLTQERGYALVQAALALTASPAGGQATDEEGVPVHFQTQPAEAQVLVDGEVLCARTPCTRRLTPGKHLVRIQAAQHEVLEETLRIRGEETVQRQLQPLMATLSVQTSPASLPVSVDGEVVGLSPLEHRLPAGRHEVVVETECHTLTGERVALEGSERRALVIVPPPRIAGLDLHLRDAQGDAREATVYADGVAVGSLPGILEVPLCTREFVIQTPEGETWRGALELEEGEILSRRIELADRQQETALLPTVTRLTSSAEAESPASFDRSAPHGPAAARSAPPAPPGKTREELRREAIAADREARPGATKKGPPGKRPTGAAKGKRSPSGRASAFSCEPNVLSLGAGGRHGYGWGAAWSHRFGGCRWDQGWGWAAGLGYGVNSFNQTEEISISMRTLRESRCQWCDRRPLSFLGFTTFYEEGRGDFTGGNLMAGWESSGGGDSPGMGLYSSFSVGAALISMQSFLRQDWVVYPMAEIAAGVSF